MKKTVIIMIICTNISFSLCKGQIIQDHMQEHMVTIRGDIIVADYCEDEYFCENYTEENYNEARNYYKNMKGARDYYQELLRKDCVGLAVNPSFSQEEQPQGAQSRYKEPTSDFRQLKNSDLVTLIESMIRPGSLVSLDEELKVMQKQYDFYLNMLSTDNLKTVRKSELNMDILTKLAWVIETNKSTYQPGEPIRFRLVLKNISDDDVVVQYPALRPGFILSSMEIKRIQQSEKQEVYMTQHGYQYYGLLGFNGTIRFFKSFQLQPGEKAPTNQNIVTLNRYYDLSQTGEYELTFYTRNFLADDAHQIGEYPKPCTIRFKIEGYTNWLDKQVVWPEEEK
jgi:hypothetical protein